MVPLLLLALAGCRLQSGSVVQATLVKEVRSSLQSKAAWSPKGNLIAMAEIDKISVYDVTKSDRPRPVRTIKMLNVVRVDWSVDGKKLLAEVSHPERAFNRAVIAEIGTLHTRKLDFEGQDFFWLGPDKIAAYTNWSYRPHPFSGLKYTQRWISYSLTDGDKKPLALNLGQAEFESHVGNLVFGLESGGYQAYKVVLYNLKTGQRQVLAKKVLEISLAPGGKAVVIDEGSKVKDEEAYYRSFYAALTSGGLKLGKPLRLVNAEGSPIQLQGLSISPNGKQVAFKALQIVDQPLFIAPLR